MQAFRRVRRAPRILPENAGAALRRNHGIDGILKHIYPIRRRQRQRAAASSLSDDNGDHRCAQTHHFQNILRNGLALSPFLRLRAAIGAERIDKTDHRAVELLRLLHQAQGLAVSLRHGAAEVVAHPRVKIRALVNGNIGHGTSLQRADAGKNRRVLPEAAVPAEVEPVAEQLLHISPARGTAAVSRGFQAFISLRHAHSPPCSRRILPSVSGSRLRSTTASTNPCSRRNSAL